MSNVDDKYTLRVPRFNGTRNSDFHLWSLTLEAALKDKKIGTALIEEVALEAT